MISIQLGNYSNYVGGQIFNIQKSSFEETSNSKTSDGSVSVNTLWRETRKQGPCPRVIIVDTKENISTRSLNPYGPPAQRSVDKNNSLWDGKLEIIQNAYEGESASDEAKVNRRQQGLEQWTDVTNWTIPSLHTHTLPDNSYNAEDGRIVSYGQGLQIAKDMEGTLEDSMRLYAEEMDTVQGFLVLADETDGYSGLCGEMLGNVADEYEKKCIICLGLVSPSYKHSIGDILDRGKKSKTFKTRMTNLALFWNSCNSYSSLFSSVGVVSDLMVPEYVSHTLPNLTFTSESHYKSSAIVASVLDTLLSPSLGLGTESALISPSGLAAYLSAFNRKFMSISSSFPFPINIKSSSFFNLLQTSSLESLSSFTPGITAQLDKATANYFSVRGIPNDSTISETEKRSLQTRHHGIKNPEDCLMAFATEAFPRSVNLVHNFATPLNICDPFPLSVVNEDALNAYNLSKKYSNGIVSNWSLSGLSSAQNTPQIGELIDRLLTEVPAQGRREGKVTQTHLSEHNLGVEIDDYYEAINGLEMLRDAYSVS